MVFEAEPMAKKYSIIASGFCLLAGYITVGGLYAARWANVDKLQSAYEDAYTEEQFSEWKISSEVTYYDVGFIANPDA